MTHRMTTPTDLQRLDDISRSGHPNSRSGPRPHRRRQCPDDFATVGQTMRHSELCKHYHARMGLIRRWCIETGITAPEYRQPSTPAPPDLAELAPTMTNGALARHYGVHNSMSARWLREAGLEAKAFRPDGPKHGYVRRTIAQKRAYAGPKPKDLPPRDGSLHGMAADHLRRTAAVYRCSERGAANQNGGFWRHGNVILTPDEMLQRAERLGWGGYSV